MLFNSYEFIFLFLPVTLIIYFLLNKQRLTVASKAWLVFASLFFYSWWNIKYLPLILISIIFNFSIGTSLSKINDNKRKKRAITRKAILIFGVVCNLLLLGYYKYTDFFLSNLTYFGHMAFPVLHIILPLGISFFTFTQIAYLVDAYKGEVKEMDYLNYSLFVTFFPHLIAGPILHHKEMMPQFDDIRKKVLNHKNLAIGIFVFAIGIFKKVVLADTLAVWANAGFDHSTTLSFVESWVTSLSYTGQLYFDFSGYTDMALGVALMFNIKLPQNFNSPYKAQNIQDFWRRWHITLSRFLKDYVYIPLGGNRISEFKTCQNLLTTFVIGGLWHGASWTFIFWGLLHGIGLVIHRLWRKLNINMHSFLAWIITFNFVNLAWVFFRAKSWSDAFKVLKGMFGLGGFTLSNNLVHKIPVLKLLLHAGFTLDSWIRKTDLAIIYVTIFILIIIFAKKTDQLEVYFKPKTVFLVITVFLILFSFSYSSRVSEFLYFNF